MRPVRVSSGAVEYRYVILTETTGKSIASDTVLVALTLVSAGQPQSSDFAAPTTDVSGPASVRTVGKIIDNTITPGEYYLWARIVDTPETVPLRAPSVIQVI